MDRHTTAWTRIGTFVAGATSGISRRSLLTVIAVLFAVFLWVITLAPAAIAFALAVGVAAAWCAWLQNDPEAARPPVRMISTPSSD